MLKWLVKLFGIHVHDWGRWTPVGVTYQERYCKTCGYGQIRDRYSMF